LVDAVDEDKMADAAELLRGLTQRGTPSDGGFSFVGALSGGPDDLAERHEDYLREMFDRRT
jgi:hypothetical protein